VDVVEQKINFQIVLFTSLKQKTILLRMNRALINRICYDHAKMSAKSTTPN